MEGSPAWIIALITLSESLKESLFPNFRYLGDAIERKCAPSHPCVALVKEVIIGRLFMTSHCIKTAEALDAGRVLWWFS